MDNMKQIKEYAIEQIKAGRTISSVAREIDVNRSTLSKNLKKWGFSKDPKHPKLKKEYVIEQIKKYKTITEIAKEIGIHRVTLSRKLKEWKISKSALHFNEHFFETIDSENKAYWLGFIMADGCVSLTYKPKLVIKIAHKDYCHLQKWHKALESCHNINVFESGIQSQHYSEKMCNDLIKLGCTPRKSNTLCFPKINENLLNHFVRGYFDGDGCASLRTHQKTPQLRISFAGTPKFLSELKNILEIDNKLQPIGNNKIARSLDVCGNKKAKQIADWMYKNATIFLERKREVCFAIL